MTFFIIGCAALVTIVLTLIALPLLRRDVLDSPAREEFDIALYRDQLAEVEKDLERGVLTQENADAARLELQRRLLSVDTVQREQPPVRPSGRTLPLVAMALVPIVAFTGYFILGVPGLSDMPIASRDIKAEQGHIQVDQIEKMVADLAERLKKDPKNQDGWQMLGRSYRVMERFNEAAEAYAQAATLSDRNPALLTEWAEMLMFAAEGQVTDQVETLFAEARKKDPENTKAWFYHAYSKAARGDLRGAMDDWMNLAAAAPKDAPWLDQVNEQIEMAAEKLGIESPVATNQEEKETSPAGPTNEQMAAAQAMSPAERQEMIRTMVDRLAEKMETDPNNLDGWLRLGRSRLQLEQVQEAKAAFKRAVDLKPNDPAILTEYASSILSAAPNPQIIETEMVEVLKRIQAVDPEDSNALWYLGLWEKQQGRVGEARKLWTLLLTKLTPDTVPWARLKGQIDSLN